MSLPPLAANPPITTAAQVWTQAYEAAVRDAAGPSGILTPRKVAAMEGPYADNVQNWFRITGRQRAQVGDVVAAGERYVKSRLADAAGVDKKLSLADIQRLPADLSEDFLTLRGKGPSRDASYEALVAAVQAANHPELNDYGKSFDVSVYPQTETRASIIGKIVDYDLSPAELRNWFSSSRGRGAATKFAADMRSIGADERANREDDPDGQQLTGAAAEKLFNDFAGRVLANVLPLNKLKSLEYAVHTIAEDGDVERRILLAKKRDDSWVAVSYTDFPF